MFEQTCGTANLSRYIPLLTRRGIKPCQTYSPVGLTKRFIPLCRQKNGNGGFYHWRLVAESYVSASLLHLSERNSGTITRAAGINRGCTGAWEPSRTHRLHQVLSADKTGSGSKRSGHQA